MNEQELLIAMVEYFRRNIFQPHFRKLQTEHADFESYSANPFLLPYQSKIIENDNNALGAAKALYYARVLSTSINTAFGAHIRKALVNCALAESINNKSNIILFTDKLTSERTGCILKSGPKTVNSGDEGNILDKLNDIQGVETRAVAILYGTEADLNPTYQHLNREIQILVGNDFWHHITGFPDFYVHLQHEISVNIANWDTGNHFQIGLQRLTRQVENNYII